MLTGYALLKDSDKDHDGVVQETVDELEDEVPDDATVYADHLDGERPNPRGAFAGVDGAPDEHIPDVVVTSGLANNLIIEVETGDSIENNSSEAKSQIDDFSISGIGA